jgi:hypothetical protein
MPDISPARRGLSLGRALRHRNYRLFFAGQSISLVGTWLTKVATVWLVLLLLAVSGLVGRPFTVLLPVIAALRRAARPAYERMGIARPRERLREKGREPPHPAPGD